MSNVIEGKITKWHVKEGMGQRGPWKKFSAIINDGWINFGFNDPGYKEGDVLKVEVEVDPKFGAQAKQHKKLEGAAAAAVPAPANNSSSGGGGHNGMGAAWGNASNVAASLIVTLKDLDALPLTAAAGKANKAKRYDEVLGIFNKMRVQLFLDAEDPQRVIDMYPDAGAVEDSSPAELPVPEIEEPEEDGGFDDEIPF